MWATMIAYGLVVVMISITISSSQIPATTADNGLKTYIVQLTSAADQEGQELEKWYKSLLSESASASISSVNNDDAQKPTMVHMYQHVITGFAAKMSEQQAKAMARTKGVLSVRAEGMYRLHTTRTPHFLGLHQNSGFWKASNYGKGVIIGLLDTGTTPGHPSFHDQGMPPPPPRWKGKCEQVAACNKKLIGMKNFFPGATSAVDQDGHGTHTSSTAAGSRVENANVFGNLANGTATGIAPMAHLAMYRVCDGMCPESAIAAGVDAAIEDGVDVISMSLGGLGYRKLYEDIIDIAAFAATEKGILVSCSAGNSGPAAASLSNEAPWILTVGAGTLDRRMRTTVYLGNNKTYDGESLYQPSSNHSHELRPLVYYPGGTDATYCLKGSLDHMDVKGKVVLCEGGYSAYKGQVVKDAGGAAVIVANPKGLGETTIAEPNVIPASAVGYGEGIEIKKYINSTSSPVAAILFRGTVVGVNTAPELASFSSRGPNYASPGILKPDIMGPGVNVLAAWPESVDDHNNPKQAANFNILTGTSMSCPHLAGVAALLKSQHPDWSPAAIKSAIMTTATQLNLNKHAIVDQKDPSLVPAHVFGIGSGHVNPSKSNDPGLVFDLQPTDYIPYLCGLGYTREQIEMITKKKVSCSKSIPEAQLNYPSFAVSLKRGDAKTYSRTVTNVGMPNSTYTLAEIHVPHAVKATLSVQHLSFTAALPHHKLTYNITFSRDTRAMPDAHYAQGHMTWVSDSGHYSVRIPFSFKFE